MKNVKMAHDTTTTKERQQMPQVPSIKGKRNQQARKKPPSCQNTTKAGAGGGHQRQQQVVARSKPQTQTHSVKDLEQSLHNLSLSTSSAKKNKDEMFSVLGGNGLRHPKAPSSYFSAATQLSVIPPPPVVLLDKRHQSPKDELTADYFKSFVNFVKWKVENRHSPMNGKTYQERDYHIVMERLLSRQFRVESEKSSDPNRHREGKIFRFDVVFQFSPKYEVAILEFKHKEKIVVKDIEQIQNYLQVHNVKCGALINFKTNPAELYLAQQGRPKIEPSFAKEDNGKEKISVTKDASEFIKVPKGFSLMKSGLLVKGGVTQKIRKEGVNHQSYFKLRK